MVKGCGGGEVTSSEDGLECSFTSGSYLYDLGYVEDVDRLIWY